MDLHHEFGDLPRAMGVQPPLLAKVLFQRLGAPEGGRIRGPGFGAGLLARTQVRDEGLQSGVHGRLGLGAFLRCFCTA